MKHSRTGNSQFEAVLKDHAAFPPSFTAVVKVTCSAGFHSLYPAPPPSISSVPFHLNPKENLATYHLAQLEQPTTICNSNINMGRYPRKRGRGLQLTIPIARQSLITQGVTIAKAKVHLDIPELEARLHQITQEEADEVKKCTILLKSATSLRRAAS